MRTRAAVILALVLTLAAPTPARAEGLMGFFSSLGSQVVKMARGIQSFFGGGEAETTPAEAQAAGKKAGAEVGRELHGLADALESTAKDLSEKGIDLGSLEGDIKALQPDLERMKALQEKAAREIEQSGSVSPATAQEVEALKKSLEPKMKAIGERVASQAQQAIETFKEKFTEEDVARLKQGMEKFGGFMKGFAEGLRNFLESQGASHEAESP